MAAIGDGVELLREAPLNDVELSDNGLVAEAGVITLTSPGTGDLEQFALRLPRRSARTVTSTGASNLFPREP